MARPQASHAVRDELVRRALKFVDIGYAASFYMVIAFATSWAINRASGRYDDSKERSKSTYIILLELVAKVWLLGIIAYAARNLLELLPLPYEGVCGFRHDMVKEVTNSAVFVAFAIALDNRIFSQLTILRQRLGST
jgi:hypothetical protein